MEVKIDDIWYVGRLGIGSFENCIGRGIWKQKREDEPAYKRGSFATSKGRLIIYNTKAHA